METEMEKYQWPPREIPCPDCQESMRFLSTGQGQRYFYQCHKCNSFLHLGTSRQYARHPSLWCAHVEACNAEVDIHGYAPNIMFLLENKGSLLPVIARCNKCRATISGLYSKAATAGFVFTTTEDEGWQKHSNDPTFTTTIKCDSCARA
jgi:hypothetical protein